MCRIFEVLPLNQVTDLRLAIGWSRTPHQTLSFAEAYLIRRYAIT